MSIEAKFDGRCPQCFHDIDAGDQIAQNDDDRWVCNDCATGVMTQAKRIESLESSSPCPRCFMVGACDCNE